MIYDLSEKDIKDEKLLKKFFLEKLLKEFIKNLFILIIPASEAFIKKLLKKIKKAFNANNLIL